MSAIISACGRYRYRLERKCSGAGATAIIMVNPSTADAEQNDATIRKLLGFGERHDWGRIIVGNLFAMRSSRVRDLARAKDPVGPENDVYLRLIVASAAQVIFAWGSLHKLPPRLRDQWREVDKICRTMHLEPHCIGSPCNDGHPRHPLMTPYSAAIRPWAAGGRRPI